jgi:hypothetical protein
MKIVPNVAHAVKQNQQKSSQNRLIPTLLQHPDGTDGIYLAPVCHACNQPILDQDDLNVCVESDRDVVFQPPLELLGKVGATEVRRIPGALRFFHKAHDPGDIKPWFAGDQVFRKQRVLGKERLGRAA